MAKFFRVAVEGATATDGRKIERVMLTDMAANFNRATYGPRINMEHIRGLSAEGPFKAYGDVLAVKTEEIELTLAGKVEKRLALFAQLDPTDDLRAVNKARQKVYTSIEVAPNFGGSGKFGLVGVAVTDNPASLGTEMLEFSGAKAMLDARKSHPDNLLSAAEEVVLDFEDSALATSDPASGAFASVKAFFDGLLASNKPPVTPPAEEKQKPANDNAAFNHIFAEGMSKMMEAVQASSTATNTRIDKFAADLGALQTKLASTEKPGFSRQSATGGAVGVETDC